MLILSRKKGQAIRINDNVTVHVLEIRGDKVKLGFTAPLEILIRRSELKGEAFNKNLDQLPKGPLADYQAD
jgi:carbon storage regulator